MVARVIAVEVEDTSKLTARKIDRYAHMWWAFDSTSELDLALLCVDRYGQSDRWFNLPALGFVSIYDSPEADKMDQPLRRQRRAECLEAFGPLVFAEDRFTWFPNEVEQAEVE